MKRWIAMLVVVCFLGVPMSSFAAKGGKKGPADKAYEKADDNAKFKRDSSEDIDETPKKKRKRIEAEENEDEGQGQKKRKKEKKRKEGAQDD